MKHTSSFTAMLSEDMSAKESLNYDVDLDFINPENNNYGLYGPDAFKKPVDIRDLLSYSQESSTSKISRSTLTT